MPSDDRSCATILKKGGDLYARRVRAPISDEELAKEGAARIDNLHRKDGESDIDFIARVNEYLEEVADRENLRPGFLPPPRT